MAEEKKSGVNTSIILLFLFLISYALLFGVSLGGSAIGGIVAGIPILNLLLPLPVFESPMFFLLPIVGFFFSYYIIDWVNSYFETKLALSPVFLLLMVILSLLAFYIALFWFAAEISRFTGGPISFDFWGELRGSAFYLFMLAGILGWVSRKVMQLV